MNYTQLSPLKYKTQKMIYYTKNAYTKMMQVPNRSYTMKEQDLAPIAPKKRLVPTLGNMEICERHYTQMNIIISVMYTMILLIKEPSGKPIAQLNLKEVI